MEEPIKIEDIKEINEFNTSEDIKMFYADEATLFRLGDRIIGYFKLFESEACVLGGELASILSENVIAETASRCPENRRQIIRFILK